MIYTHKMKKISAKLIETHVTTLIQSLLCCRNDISKLSKLSRKILLTKEILKNVNATDMNTGQIVRDILNQSSLLTNLTFDDIEINYVNGNKTTFVNNRDVYNDSIVFIIIETPCLIYINNHKDVDYTLTKNSINVIVGIKESSFVLRSDNINNVAYYIICRSTK